jgi:hypothetical protein
VLITKDSEGVTVFSVASAQMTGKTVMGVTDVLLGRNFSKFSLKKTRVKRHAQIT